MSWIKKITVEPTMFLQMAGDTLTYVIYQNLFIEKICRVHLQYSPEICEQYDQWSEHNLNTTSTTNYNLFKPIMNNIQTASARFVLYNSLVENCLCVFIVLSLGHWSDTNRRRKPPLILSLIGKLARSIGLFLNAWFMEWPPIILLLTTALPHCLGGGNPVFHMSSFSYIADTSAPRKRTQRLAIAEAVWQIGNPTGLFLGSFLFSKGSYLYVFGMAVLFHLTAVLYTSFALREVPKPKPSQYTLGKHGWYGSTHNFQNTLQVPFPKRNRHRSLHGCDDAMDPNHNNNPFDIEKDETDSLLPASFSRPEFIPREITTVHEADNQTDQIPIRKSSLQSVKHFVIGSVSTVFKKRPNHTRKCLLSLGFIMLLCGIVHHGEINMKYLFTRNRFQWREQEFSAWTTFEGLMIIIGLIILLPIFNSIFKFSDPFSGSIASFGRFISKICITFAPSSIYLYAASAIDVVGVIGPLSARSLASKCVKRDERGQVFAFLGCIEAIVPLLAVPLYSVLYSYTLTDASSAIYLLSSGLVFIQFLIFGILFIAMRLNIVEFTGTDTSALTKPLDRNVLAQEYGIDEEAISYWNYRNRRTSLS